MGRKKIPEIHYRSSRICRVLGNPTAYEIIKVLARRKMRPADIAHDFGLSRQTICDALRSLRQLDLVRYETSKCGKFYTIKEEQLPVAITELERLVKVIQGRK
ncbi:MAG: ArsR family transcriptional regulator [bacterium]